MYVVRVKFEDASEWLYVGGRIVVDMVPKNELGRTNSHGQTVMLKDFFMTEKESKDFYFDLLKEASGDDGYGRRIFSAIARVECNSTYEPYTEWKVIDYRQF